MEYQRKARRHQLRILIYVLSIFVCSIQIQHANSSTTTSTTTPRTISYSFSASTTTSKAPLSSLAQPQHASIPQHAPPTTTTNASLPLASQASKLFPGSLVVDSNKTSTGLSSTTTQSQSQPSHQALSEAAPSNNKPSTLPSPSASALSSLSSSTSSPSRPATKNTITTTLNATTALATAGSRQKANQTGRVCGPVHVRNDLSSFTSLKECRIINGPLTIALVSNISNPKDYDNLTFPLLTEVYDYLLFFRVQNLTTLAKLFPNLSVIRGRKLVSHYALIIYEMMHLQRVDLPNLNDILRGAVRIENNPNLCYATTVNWDGICKARIEGHYIKDNNLHCKDRCPDSCRPWEYVRSENVSSSSTNDVVELGSNNNHSLYCWNGQDCHEQCPGGNASMTISAPGGGCCAPQCAGGCHIRDRADQCISCRKVSSGNTCVDTCDPDRYEFDGQCLTKLQCEQVVVKDLSKGLCATDQDLKEYKAVRAQVDGEMKNMCQEQCPAGYEEDPTNKHRCKLCDKGKCKKVCTPQNKNKLYMVNNFNMLNQLSGCNVINGSLEISMKGGKNTLNQLEINLRDLEEISGYLKITRSYSILTLDFLRNLKVINGTILERDLYSLVIIDNPNLQELFLFNKNTSSGHKQLQILGGKIFVHLNPKLCPYKIHSLKDYAVVADWDEDDVSIHNNGDKEACNTEELEVEFNHSLAHMAKITFQNLVATMSDQRSLLYYLINYREVPNGTVTMFDGRDGCNSQNDVWITVEEPPAKVSRNSTKKEPQTVYIEVKPATRYALYVKTFTISSNSKDGLSNIIYFETAPDTPGIPRELRGRPTSHNEISVTWQPPSKPNGKILNYIITITKSAELEDVQNLDVCDSIISRDTITRTLTKTEPNQLAFSKVLNKNVPTDARFSEGSPVLTQPSTSCRLITDSAENQEEKVTFQDTILDLIYLKQNCIAPSPSKPAKEKKKRSIERDPSSSESMSENSLPRKSTSLDQQVSARASTNLPESGSNKIFNASAALNSKKQGSKSASIRFDSNRYKTEAKVPAPNDTTKAITSVIGGLEHFRLYTIEVVACHGEFRAEKVKTSNTYKKCSLEAVTQVRTNAIPELDKVNASAITFHPANETRGFTVTWDKPTNPNGLALAFRVRYRPKNGNQDVRNEVCINITAYERDQGLTLPNIGPGKYLLSVQTLSMYTEQRFWSDEREFEIPQTHTLAPWAWTLIIMTTIVLIMLGASTILYLNQKRTRDDLIYASVNPDYVQYNPDEWEVDKAKLIVGAQIGTGSFGMVYKGQLITEKGTRDCAVKTVPPTSTAKQRIDFLREASIMKQFDTFHVVKLLGVVSITTPVYVIMEYMENGDLKEFLRNQREIHAKQNKNLVDGIYLMAAQIADGMAYLASKKFVHRDLAARNCMVGDNRIVKIGDFGLTRDIYANDYYRRDTQGRLPVRWMAPESLSDNICTSSSDVWSYGIVLWEIVTFSAYPYQGLSNDEVIKRVTQGYTMPRPKHCPDKLFNIMERCWRKNDKDRPTFLDIVEYLLPDTDGKMYPNCFYRRPKVEGDSIAQSIPEDTNTGTESYPLLSWPSANRANGLSNGENHMNHNHSSERHGD